MEIEMKTTEKIEVRRDAVARAPHLFLAAISAALALGQSKAAFDDGDPKLTEADEKFADANHAAVETLAAVCKEADSFRAMSARPQTILEALNAVAGAQKYFALSADEYLARLGIWRGADAQTARIRVSVSERLALPAPEGKGLSATAADKAASGDPEYTQHKDACADLADMKDASEFEMKVAEQNVRGAIATLEAFTALQRSGYPVAAASPSTDSREAITA
jgi:hypothetical protein